MQHNIHVISSHTRDYYTSVLLCIWKEKASQIFTTWILLLHWRVNAFFFFLALFAIKRPSKIWQATLITHQNVLSAQSVHTAQLPFKLELPLSSQSANPVPTHFHKDFESPLQEMLGRVHPKVTFCVHLCFYLVLALDNSDFQTLFSPPAFLTPSPTSNAELTLSFL